MKSIICKFLIIFSITSLATVKVFAQNNNTGVVSGKLVDATTNEPVPYGAAILYDKKTMARVSAVQTDLDGNFSLPNIPFGVYTFKASYLGYQTMVRDSVNINANNRNIAFGTIKMKEAAGNEISEVTVTAQRATMQMGIDKKIFSVDQSLVSEGGSASDVLQNVPSVQTDIDGNVSLRGSSGVRVLIDGKPSLIAGGNIAQILQSIPASSIETIELITNPSAKYDAEGQSGIINIVLKRNKKLGFNGSVALTGGIKDNYNGNTNLSFQNSKINLFGNYSYRNGSRDGGGFNNIRYINSSSPTFFANQNTVSKSVDKSHNLKTGIDVYLSDKDIMSFSGGFNIRDNNRNELLRVNQLGEFSNPLQLSNRNNINKGSGDSYDLNFDYTRKFSKPQEELTLNFSYSNGQNSNVQTYNTNIYNINGNDVIIDPAIQLNTNSGNNNNMNIQADYTLPLKNGKIEAGYRSQIRNSESNTLASNLNYASNNYDVNYALTNDFNNKDQVHAAYFNFQSQINNFGYQIGLRAEDAKLNTMLGAFDPNGAPLFSPGKIAYTRIYPSVFLTQKLKNELQAQLSYSRRVNRPRGWDTNPFLDVSDPLNFRQGNPNLRPEDVNAFELSLSKYFSNASVTTSAYLRQTSDVIQRIMSEPDANGVTTTMPQNLTKSSSSGLEIIGRLDVSKKWNFTANVNMFRNNITGVPAFGIAENSGFSWNANLTNNFTLPYNITLQIKGDYRAAEVQAQGKRNAMYGFDGGAKYDFPDKKSSLSLNVRDIFATRRWSNTNYGQYSTANFERFMQGTMANLTYSYRFGKSMFDMKKSKRPTQQESRPDEENF